MRIELVGARYSEGYLNHIRETKLDQITDEFQSGQRYAIYLKPSGLYQWETEKFSFRPEPLEDLLRFIKEAYGGHLAKLMREGVYQALDDAEAMKEALTQAQRERRNDDRWASEYGNLLVTTKGGTQKRAALISEGKNNVIVRLIGENYPSVVDKQWVKYIL